MKPSDYETLRCPSSLFVSEDGRLLYTEYAWDGSRRVCVPDFSGNVSEPAYIPADADPCPAFEGEAVCYLSSGRFRTSSGLIYGEEDWQVYGFALTGEGHALLKLRREERSDTRLMIADALPYRRDADHGFVRRYQRKLVLVKLPRGDTSDRDPARPVAEGKDDWRFLVCRGDTAVYGAGHWMCLDLQSGKVSILCEDLTPGGFAPVFSPDGKSVIVPGYWKNDSDLTLWKIHLRGEKPVEPVSSLPDTVGRGGVYADLSPDTPTLMTCWKGTVLFVGVSQGKSGLYRISEADGCLRAEPLCSLPGTVFEAAGGGDGLYVIHGDDTQAPYVGRLDPGRGKLVPVSGKRNPPSIGAVSSTALQTASQDGKAILHARLILPPAAGSDSVPLLVWLHGGPEGYYTDALDTEKQAAVSRGYAVLLPNPRGSSGYGAAYQHTGEAFSGGAARDVLTLLDATLETWPCIDRERIGILGGSYGGFLSAFLAGHTNRFRTAAILKPVTNWLFIHFKSSQSGQPVFAEHFSFRDFLSDTFRMSPAAMADHITIPTLLIHGAEDQQCPPENSLQLFRLIRAYHPEIPCELKLYPHCCHAYSRDGLQDYISIQEEVLRWMDAFLLPAEAAKENVHEL